MLVHFPLFAYVAAEIPLVLYDQHFRTSFYISFDS